MQRLGQTLRPDVVEEPVQTGHGCHKRQPQPVGQRAGIQAREHLAAPHFHGTMAQVVDEPRPAVERCEQRPARRRVVALAAVDRLRGDSTGQQLGELGAGPFKV